MLISEPLIMMIHSGVGRVGVQAEEKFLEADGQMDLSGFRMCVQVCVAGRFWAL